MRPGPTHRLAVIGCGAFGRFCLETVASMDGIELAALVDTDARNLDAASRVWRTGRKAGADAPVLMKDHRELLQLPDIDTVWVITPPYLHHRLAKDLLMAGKHLFLEKPGSLTVAQADEILALSRSKGLHVAIDFVMRHNPIYTLIAELHHAGLLGPLERFALENLAADENLPPQHWFWHPELSGGIWIEHGVHFFDLAAWLAGTPESLVSTAISRENGEVGLRGGAAGMVDSVSATVIYGNPGVSEKSIANFYHSFTRPRVLECTRASLGFQRANLNVKGWVAEELSGRVLAGEGLLEKLSMHPWLEVETLEEYREKRVFLGRGRNIPSENLIAIRGSLGDRQEVYRESIRKGLRGLLDAVAGRDSGMVSFSLARDAIRLAEAATVSQRERTHVPL